MTKQNDPPPLGVRAKHPEGGDFKPIIHTMEDGQSFVLRHHLPGHVYVGDLVVIDRFAFAEPRPEEDVPAVLLASEGHLGNGGFFTAMSLMDHTPHFGVGSQVTFVLAQLKRLDGIEVHDHQSLSSLRYHSRSQS